MLGRTHSRRRFLAALAGGLTALALPSRPALASAMGRIAPNEDHPEPRPGIDASRVLPADQVRPRLVELYDHVREIPHVVDGIRCYCGCADLDGFHSLLSCYEDAGMAQHCDVCQGEAELVYRLHGEGRTLDEIRAAIDRRFA